MSYGIQYARAVPRAERLVRSAWRIYCGGEVTSAWLQKRLGISPMSASRDMAILMQALPIRDKQPKKKGLIRRLSLAKIVVERMNKPGDNDESS